MTVEFALFLFVKTRKWKSCKVYFEMFKVNIKKSEPHIGEHKKVKLMLRNIRKVNHMFVNIKKSEPYVDEHRRK